jgi:hypothetical protein
MSCFAKKPDNLPAKSKLQKFNLYAPINPHYWLLRFYRSKLLTCHFETCHKQQRNQVKEGLISFSVQKLCFVNCLQVHMWFCHTRSMFIFTVSSYNQFWEWPRECYNIPNHKMHFHHTGNCWPQARWLNKSTAHLMQDERFYKMYYHSSGSKPSGARSTLQTLAELSET